MTIANESLALAATTLLRGPLYAQDNPKAWQALRQNTAPVRDFLGTLGIRVVIDEAEEYAWLLMTDDLPDDLPRLIRRHRLSHGCTVMLVSLRQAMLHEETREATDRFVFTGAEIIEFARTYHPDTVADDSIRNDVLRLLDQGYLRRMRGQADTYEALRIIKAHVTADWIAEYADKLRATVVPDGPEGIEVSA